MTLALMGAGKTASVAPFDPSAISGLTGWWKADAIVGKNDGDAISQWDDSSGNAQHGTQATGAAKPTYKTAIQNSLPAVRFATNDFLALPGTPLTLVAGSALTVLSVCANVGNVRGVVIGRDDASLGRDYVVGFDSSGPKAVYMERGGAVVPISTTFTAAAHVFSIHATAGATDGVGFIDGAAVGSDRPTGTASANTALTNIGRRSYGGVEMYLSADICELVVYNVKLSTGDRQLVEAWLKAKWSTP